MAKCGLNCLFGYKKAGSMDNLCWGGYAINHAKDLRNFPYAGWLIQKTYNKAITFGIEVFTQGAVSIDSRAFTLINAGGTYSFTENLMLQLSAGHSVQGENHTVAYLSLLWTGKIN